jgi:hypothetical protein
MRGPKKNYEHAHQLAKMFDDAVSAFFPDNNVAVDVVAGGCAILLSTILAAIPPIDRALVLNETVEAILAGYADKPDADLILEH